MSRASRTPFYNAVHECDKQIGRLVDELKSLGRLDDTIIIVTGENGEAFHECGGKVSHARESIGPAIHVACVMHAPKFLQAKRESYPLEHVDLMPTLLSLMQLPAHPNFQGIDIFSPERPPAEDRYTFTHVNTGLAHGDSIMVGGRWKLWVDRQTRGRLLYDTWNDPNEERELSQSRPDLLEELDEALHDWRHQQLSYYHFPHFYLTYYPPLPPTRGDRATKASESMDATVQSIPADISTLTAEAAVTGPITQRLSVNAANPATACHAQRSERPQRSTSLGQPDCALRHGCTLCRRLRMCVEYWVTVVAFTSDRLASA